jgi:hypothetical protein
MLLHGEKPWLNNHNPVKEQLLGPSWLALRNNIISLKNEIKITLIFRKEKGSLMLKGFFQFSW